MLKNPLTWRQALRCFLAMHVGKKGINYLCGITWFLLSMVIGVANDTIMKFLGTGYSLGQIVCLRYGFATLFLALFGVRGKNIKGMFMRMPKLHIIRAIFLLLAMSLYCQGLHKLPIATVMSLNFAIPLFILVFARIFLKEKIRRDSVVATIIGFVGVYCIFEPTNEGFSTLAAILLLLSSMLFAALDIVNKKFVGDEGVFQMVFYTAIITFIFSLPFALHAWILPSLRDIVLFIMLGGGANLLLYCILKAFEKVNVSMVAPFRYLELILAVGVGFFLFNEIPSKNTICGSLVIITSTIYIVYAGIKDG
ncbi:MAG: DMT family transporter [Puniceicoccales bacterium]|jgi:drug/metabolite transporter (DMT)-like permease|nr:DMT family transporter [Puniceicoccales bacterium]